MKTGIGAIVGLAVTISGIPLLAHHTISAVYDVDKLVTLKGVVTEVDWQNPHVVIHLDVKNDDGGVVSWNVETQAIYILKKKRPRSGLHQDRGCGEHERLRRKRRRTKGGPGIDDAAQRDTLRVDASCRKPTKCPSLTHFAKNL